MSYPRDIRQPRAYNRYPHPGAAQPRSRLASQQAAQSRPRPQAQFSSRAAQPRSRAKTFRKRDRGHSKVLLAGSSVAVLALLAFVPTQLKPQTVRSTPTSFCQDVVRSGAELSRDQLSRLIAIPERSSKQSVRQIAQAPYCVQPPLAGRAGAETVREAYPLAFDPSTWFVVLYKGDEYAGYDFTFRH